MAGAGHVARAAGDLGSLSNNELRLYQLALQCKRPRQPKAGVDREAGEDTPVRLGPDAATPGDRLVNTAALTQREAERKGCREI